MSSPERERRPIPEAAPTESATTLIDTGHDTVLAVALAYTVLGWPVFPCTPGAKEPLGRLAPNGFKNATVDHSVILDWWTRAPSANVGIATGAPGPDVVDFDCKKGAPGIFTMRRLQHAGLLAGAALLIGTPSGGWHLYYKGTGQACTVVRDHGVDFRSAGGYVVAPPSIVDDDAYGGPYLLHDARVPRATVDFTRIRRFLDPPKQRARASASEPAGGDWSGLVAHVARQQDGNRNAALYWSACCAAKEHAPDAIKEALVDAAVSAGLTKTEAQKTVASAYRRFGTAS